MPKDGGIDLDALGLALSQWPVNALVLTPNFSNPLGARIPYGYYAKPVALLNQFEVTLIEDDVFAELSYDGSMSLPLSSLLRGSSFLSVTPGVLFPPQDNFTHHVRLNYASLHLFDAERAVSSRYDF